MKEVREFYNEFDTCRDRDIPLCADACPFKLDILEVQERITKKRFNAAYKTIRDCVGFPGIVAEICPAYCQKHCIRECIDASVQIRQLEKSINALASRKDPNSYNLPKKENRVAVIGGGISGMAFALKMAGRKYDVTVYEKTDKIGGSLKGLMTEELYMQEFDLQFKNETYNLELNTNIEDISKLEGFDVIYVATGKGKLPRGISPDLDSASPSDTEIGSSGFNMTDFPLNPPCTETVLSDGAKAGVFVGGEALGRDVMFALADGMNIAATADNYIKTGTLEYPVAPPPSKCVTDPDELTENPVIIPSGAADTDAVASTNPATGMQVSCNTDTTGELEPTYNEEEIIAEASRCIRCKCDGCDRYCDLVNFYATSPVKMRDEVFLTVKPAGSLVHKAPARKYIAACTDCRIMEEGACPEQIELCSMIKAARHQMHSAEKMPAAYKQYFTRDMEFANSDLAAIVKGGATRHSEDDSGTRDGTGAPNYAFFPGCNLGALNPEYVIRPYRWLRDKYPGTGLLLKCCSVPIDWAGNTEALEEEIATLKKDWKSLGKPVLVTACLSCDRHLHEYLPEIETITLYELMAQNLGDLPVAAGETGASATTAGIAASANDEDASSTNASVGTAKVAGGPDKVYTIFDPCSARGRDEVLDSVRQLAKSCGLNVEELHKKDMHGCCGFGGQGAVAQPKFTEAVVNKRVSMSDNPYIVYCSNCHDMFVGQGKETIHILDALFGINLAIEANKNAADSNSVSTNSGSSSAGTDSSITDTNDSPSTSKLPKLPNVTQRRENRIKLKELLLEEMWGETMDNKPESLPYELIMDDTVAAKVEKQRILADDICSVIKRAEETGRRTRNPENGRFKAYNEIGAITLWVEYECIGDPADNKRQIINVFSHRMQIKLEAVFNGKKIDG